MTKKIDRAVEIARGILRENPEINDTLLRTKVKEAVPCKRTTAYKAVNTVREESRERAKAEEPHIETIKPIKGAKTPEIEPIGEIEEPLIPPEIIEPPPEVGEPEFIRDMLENIHALFLSSDGLFEEYGVSVKEAERQGRGAYMVLKDQVGEEALRKYGVYMLLAGYLGIVGKMGAKLWKKRRKEKLKEKTTEKKPKPKKS